MTLFNVSIAGVYVVAAQDSDEAMKQARMIFEGADDVGDLEIVHIAEIASEADLVDDWKPDCVPYGVSENRSISEILAMATGG